MEPITQLLRASRNGEPQALAALFDAMYPELRTIARRRLAKDDRGTLLDTTSLVHECFLKLAAVTTWRSRTGAISSPTRRP